MQINNIKFSILGQDFPGFKTVSFARINFRRKCSDKKFGKIIVYVYRKISSFLI